MGSFLLLGAPRSGSTHVCKILSYLYQSKYILSEPVRAKQSGDDCYRSISDLLVRQSLSLSDLYDSELTPLKKSNSSYGIKETLRFHIVNDYPTSAWTLYITNQNHYEFSNIYTVIRNPIQNIESIINRYNFHPFLEGNERTVCKKYLCNWIYNFNRIFQFSKVNRIQIIQYEHLFEYPYILSNPSIFRLTNNLLPSNWSDLLPPILGIGDERAMGFQQFRNNNNFKLSYNDIIYICENISSEYKTVYGSSLSP